MKRIFLLVFGLGTSAFLFAQNNPTDTVIPENATIDTLPIIQPPAEEEEDAPKKKSLTFAQLGMATRPKDHLLIQVGVDGWANKTDDIRTKGLSRSFNMYFMFDFPFKTNPHLSLAVGAGISTSNIYFSNTYIDITGKTNTTKITFNDVSSADHFKKYKLLTTFAEAPVEFRYVARPETPKKSFKAAIGGKIGTLLSASTKGKNLLNSTGQNIGAYTEKEKSKRFFNGTRMSVTGRVGYGALSLFGAYQVNTFFKEGMGPDVRPFSVGITISGL